MDEGNWRYILGFVVFVAKGAVNRRGSFPENRNKIHYNTQKSRGEAVVGRGQPYWETLGVGPRFEAPRSATRRVVWHAGNCSSM